MIAGRRAMTLVEMLVVVALTVLLMSIIAEVFVLASETMHRLKSVSSAHQKIRHVESTIRMDLANRTIRQVQPPVERMAGPDGIHGTTDDWVLPVGIDPRDNLGYFMIQEHSPADEQGEDTDDVLAFTVRYLNTAVQVVQGQRPAFVGRARVGSEPDQAFPPIADGLTGSDEAEVIYFLRRGTLYRRVLLVGVPQPSPGLANYDPARSWYEQYDISARPPLVAGDVPIVNTLGELSYRSTRFGHRPPANYLTGDPATVPPVSPGLAADYPGDPLFGPTGFAPGPLEFDDSNANSFHDAQTLGEQLDHNANYPFAVGGGPLLSRPELWFGRPLLRETSSPAWNYPNDVTSTVWADFNTPASPRYHANLYSTALRPAEDALLTNVLSFNIRVWDPDAIPNLTFSTVRYPGGMPSGAYVDLGKLWPGASPSVTAPGTQPSGGTLVGFPGLFPFPPQGPQSGNWPPQRPVGVTPNRPDGRGFAEPFGYNYDPSFPAPPRAIPADPPPPGYPFGWQNGMQRAPFNLARTYDTWCTAYTKPTQVGVIPVAPPYIVPLRGIEIQIRFVEYDDERRTSLLTKEITIVQELQ